MNKDYAIYIKHILESIDLIEHHIKKSGKKGFKGDITTQDAVFRRLEIIGEAVKKLPSKIKNKFPDAEWKDVAGMRDILIHHYYNIDLDIVKNTIKKDLPALKKTLKAILKDLSK